MTFPTAKQFEADRNRAFADFTTPVERAKAAGKLRADFVTEDMPMFLTANAGVLTATAEAAPDTWRRLSATSSRPAPHPPPSRCPIHPRPADAPSYDSRDTTPTRPTPGVVSA